MQALVVILLKWAVDLLQRPGHTSDGICQQRLRSMSTVARNWVALNGGVQTT